MHYMTKEAKWLQKIGDSKGLRNKMTMLRKIKCQRDNMWVSLETIENNMDEIANSDMTKDIINSLKKSTEAMKAHCIPAGGIDGVQEAMDDLQTELQNAQEITDIIHRGTTSLSSMSTAPDLSTMDDRELLEELNSLLLEDGDKELLELPEVDRNRPQLMKDSRSTGPAEEPDLKSGPAARDSGLNKSKHRRQTSSFFQSHGQTQGLDQEEEGPRDDDNAIAAV
jgi:hypothetical protein